ncbi:MAG TPA: carboxypeptidase regulatory-like domain-containing protein [Steroidobacteraceae bacterium]|nr:carboxypeptidase regulatory-like domain-containing protein [Steroidobacteraceae bacterium]
MTLHKHFAAGLFRIGIILAASFALAACPTSKGSGGGGGGGGTTFGISGTVGGAASVTVKLSGAAAATATTDGSGNYTFMGLANGSYTVTPSLSGYTFTPASSAVSVNGANVAATDFTAAAAPSTFTITGMVTTGAGAASSGVTLTLSGAASASQVSNTSGAYTFTGLAAGSYTVTPSLAGFTFAPASDALTISTANGTATTFVATPAVQGSFSIAGTVSGAVAAGVKITVSGKASATATTAANGSYSVPSLADGSYVVTPSLSGYTFSPVSSSVSVNGANITGTNFTASANAAPTFRLSGAVSGAWAANVTIKLSGASTRTTTTDANGNYAFANLPAASYTVTPTLAGYTYTPAAPAVTLSANTTQNFVAASAFTAYSISGTLRYAGTKTGPVNLWVYQSCSTCTGQSAVAGSSVTLGGSAGAYTGSYTIRGLQPGSYVVAAEIDTLASGISNAANPAGITAVQNISTANIAGANVTLADPGVIAPTPPSSLSASPKSASALISYNPVVNANDQELATSYKVYWGTDAAASNGGSKTFAAQGQNVSIYMLPGIANGAIYFKMTALEGTTESAPTAVVGPVTVGASSGANTVSGTVTFPGTATGSLIVGVHSNSGAYYSIIANPVSPQSYSVAGVPNGTYQNFALVDMNNNGTVNAGDLSNVGGHIPSIAVSGNMTGNVTLTGAAETAFIGSEHWTDGISNQYSFNVSSVDGTKRAVAVTLYSGPNVAVPFDLGATANNNVYVPLGNGATRPTVGDTYYFKITYSDGTTADISTSVSGVLDAFATSLLVNTGAPYSRNVPQFMWSAPAAPPALYAYFVSVSGSDANWNYPQNKCLPSTTLSAVYDSDGSASKSTLTTGVSYLWQITVEDEQLKNTATYQAPAYTP